MLARWGGRYIPITQQGVQLLSFFFASLGIFFILYNTDLTPLQTQRLFQSVMLLVLGANIILLATMLLLTPTARRHLDLWAAGKPRPEEEAQKAWEEIVTAVPRFSAIAMAVATVEVILPAAAYMYYVTQGDINVAIHVALGGFLSAIALITIDTILFEIATTPARLALLPGSFHAQVAGLENRRMRLRLTVLVSSLIVITLLMTIPMAYQQLVNLMKASGAGLNDLPRLQFQFTLISFLALALGVILTNILLRTMDTPLRHLVDVMTKVQQGDLSQRAPVTGLDESGLIAVHLNHMLDQLEELQKRLEEKVAEQTALLTRRVTQLEAAAHVAREAAIHEDVRTLLDNVAHLISERFNFYHTGIFILDERGEYAVLQAASSEGGRRMLQRGHRLKVGEQGIVGLVAAQRRPHIALDVGEDAVFFNNPDLPLTRSEMALPLISRGNVIGVLDIQSTQPAAFTQDDVQILQTLADQLAVAIENARLLNESRIVVQQLELIAREQTRQGWSRWIRRRQHGYIYSPLGIEPLDKEKKRETTPTDDLRRLELPITLRGQTIGTIVLQRKKAQPPWTAKERSLAAEIISQASLALENARLLEETQRRASEEQLVREVATNIHATLDMDTVLRTAAQEIYRALDLEMAEVLLNIPDEKEKGNGSQQ